MRMGKVGMKYRTLGLLIRNPGQGWLDVTWDLRSGHGHILPNPGQSRFSFKSRWINIFTHTKWAFGGTLLAASTLLAILPPSFVRLSGYSWSNPTLTQELMTLQGTKWTASPWVKIHMAIGDTGLVCCLRPIRALPDCREQSLSALTDIVPLQGQVVIFWRVVVGWQHIMTIVKVTII